MNNNVCHYCLSFCATGPYVITLKKVFYCKHDTRAQNTTPALKPCKLLFTTNTSDWL